MFRIPYIMARREVEGMGCTIMSEANKVLLSVSERVWLQMAACDHLSRSRIRIQNKKNKKKRRRKM